MFLSIGMLKLNYFLADIFILSAEKQPIKLSWRKIECLPYKLISNGVADMHCLSDEYLADELLMEWREIHSIK